jgi:hypothetical protein
LPVGLDRRLRHCRAEAVGEPVECRPHVVKVREERDGDQCGADENHQAGGEFAWPAELQCDSGDYRMWYVWVEYCGARHDLVLFS